MSVKILYLYPDFMSLYGDNGNVRILTRRLEDQEFFVEIESQPCSGSSERHQRDRTSGR